MNRITLNFLVDFRGISEIGRLWIMEELIKFSNVRIRVRSLGYCICWSPVTRCGVAEVCSLSSAL